MRSQRVRSFLAGSDSDDVFEIEDENLSVVDDSIGTDYVYGVASAGLSYALSEAGDLHAGLRYGGSDLAGGGLVDDSIAETFRSSGLWRGLGLSAKF